MRKIPLLAAFVVLTVAGPAKAATVTIGMSVDGGPITTLDSSATGVAMAFGSGGGFGLLSATGIAYPTLAAFPDFSTSSLDVTTTASTTGSLSIYITEQGVGGAGSAPISDRLDSTLTTNSISLGLSVTLATYLDSTDGLFSTTDLLASTGSMSVTATDQVVEDETLLSPYAITAVYTLTADDAQAGAQANSTINVASVPEPGSMGVFGLAVLCLVWLVRAGRGDLIRMRHRARS